MLKNYLKVSLRNLLKHKIFSIINISGLAIGMACSILIFLYVQHEISYDQFHEKKNRIFRLVLEEIKGDESTQKLFFPAGLPAALQEEFPEVEEGTEIFGGSEEYLKFNDKTIKTRSLEVYKSFFEIFSFPLISGNPKTALSEPNSIVISESFAKINFPSINPIGLTLTSSETFSDPVTYIVTGVMRDMPDNSHMQADVIITHHRRDEFTNWKSTGSFSFHQYLLLAETANVEEFEKKLSSFYTKFNFPEGHRLILQPVQDIHLYSTFERNLRPGGDIRYVYILSAAALLILLIACINFVNLSTPRSLNKAKEVGVRKTLGAFRSQLIAQFFIESFLFILLAFVFAIIISELVLPYFSQLYGTRLQSKSLFTFSNITILSGALLIIAIFSGLYPALILSSQKPIYILKGILKAPTLDATLRKSLVVFQFSISIILIIATLVIYLQLQYISNKRLGYNQEHLVVLPNRNLNYSWTTFKEELSQHNNIENLSVTNFKVADYGLGTATFEDPNDPGKDIVLYSTAVDVDFLETLQAEMSEGRFFSLDYPSDFQGIQYLNSSISFSDSLRELEKSRSIIINETAVKSMGLEPPLTGKTLNFKGLQGNVIGVIKDFHGKSLHQEIPPVVLYAAKTPTYGNVFIRVHPDDLNNTISFIEDKWKSIYPEQPFDFFFFEDSLQQLYISEKRMGQLFLVFAFLGILVACFGLLGLAVFSAEQRVKEIGIRKVLGASVKTIVALLTKDFLKLVIVAVVIAAPVGYYLLNIWLQGFAYKIDIEWWILICAGAVAILIAIITISFQAVKAALTNPVDSLRSE